MFSKEVYIERRKRLRSKIKSGIALFLGNNDVPMSYPSNTYRFRQDSSFLYYFGINLPGFAGIVDFEKDTDYLFGNDIDIEDIIWMGHLPSVQEQAENVGISKTYPLSELQTKIDSAIKKGRRIHFLPPYRHDNMMILNDLLGIGYNNIKKYTSVDLIKAVISMRSIKEPCEIAEIEKACDVGYLMHTTAMKMCKPGVYEREIAGVIEGITLSAGGDISFPVILSQRGEILHNHGHAAQLEKGKLMLVDAGAETDLRYCSDFTRTTPVGGKFTQKQKEVYDIVLAANNHTHRAAKPGVKYQQIHLEASKIIASGLKDLGIMKGDIDEAVRNGAHALFLPHGLGHMMGLDVHDMENLGEDLVGYDDETSRIDQFGTAYLRLGRRLEPGFVLTNEPGIYFIPALIDKWKAEGINTAFINYDKLNEYYNFGGIRLEDDLLITESGCKNLGSKRIPITTEDVEATVNQ